MTRFSSCCYFTSCFTLRHAHGDCAGVFRNGTRRLTFAPSISTIGRKHGSFPTSCVLFRFQSFDSSKSINNCNVKKEQEGHTGKLGSLTSHTMRRVPNHSLSLSRVSVSRVLCCSQSDQEEVSVCLNHRRALRVALCLRFLYSNANRFANVFVWLTCRTFFLYLWWVLVQYSAVEDGPDQTRYFRTTYLRVALPCPRFFLL
jgi:hypothetical protein